MIKFSLNNRAAILVMAALCMVAGIYAALHAEVDVFPDLNAPTVVVMTEAEGMAPEEVERLVTFPIETAVNGATNVRRVRSSSSTGFSIVNIEFDWGTDIYRARQIVSEKIAMVGESLPSNVGNPTLGPQASILGELMIIGLTADTTSMQDLRTLADWTLRPRLLSTGGVAQVSVIGGDIKEYQILLDPGRMRHYGVSLDEVIYAVKDMNRNAPGGTLYQYGNEYIVRGVLATGDICALQKAVVKTTARGLPVTLEAIADVKIGAKAPILGVASNDGKPAVLLTVTKQPNTNSLELTRKLDRELADRNQTAQYQFPGAHAQTGPGTGRNRFLPTGRRPHQHGDLPPVAFHRSFYRERQKIPAGRRSVRGPGALYLPDELAHHPHLTGFHPALHPDHPAGNPLDGPHHQYHEPGRHCHRHRLAGR